MNTIKFLKLKMGYGQGYWFSAEYYIDGVLRIGEGCHYSNMIRVKEIKAKFESLLKV